MVQHIKFNNIFWAANIFIADLLFLFSSWLNHPLSYCFIWLLKQRHIFFSFINLLKLRFIGGMHTHPLWHYQLHLVWNRTKQQKQNRWVCQKPMKAIILSRFNEIWSYQWSKCAEFEAPTRKTCEIEMIGIWHENDMDEAIKAVDVRTSSQQGVRRLDRFKGAIKWE